MKATTILLIAILATGCATTSQLPVGATLQVKPQVECIGLDRPSRARKVGQQIGDAFEAAVTNPQSNIGGALGASTGKGGSPEGAIMLLPIFAAAGAIAVVERGVSFADNLRDVDLPAKSTTRAGAQVANAARQADVQAMFSEFLPVSESGDLLVIVRSVDPRTKWGRTHVTIAVELVSTADEQVLKRYTHKVPYRAEHPDLVAKRRTPTLAIRAGVAEIANAIKADLANAVKGSF